MSPPRRLIRARAALIDLDGVLTDSIGNNVYHWRAWASQHRLSPEEVHGLLNASEGMSGPAFVARLSEHFDLRFSAKRSQQVADEITKRQIEDPRGVVAMPGAFHLLASLKRLEMPVAIVTGCRSDLAYARLCAAGFVDAGVAPLVVVGSEMVSRGKPDPLGYTVGAAELETHPRDCLVFEDSLNGVRAGAQAGTHVVALTTTVTDRAELLRAGATHVVSDLSRVSALYRSPETSDYLFVLRVTDRHQGLERPSDLQAT